MTKYDSVLLETAYNFASLSSCKRLKVGAVIAKDGRPLVTGYNGTIAGLDNCCEETVSTKHQCQKCGCDDEENLILDSKYLGNFCNCCLRSGEVVRGKLSVTSDFVVHAEQNAIFYAARNGITTEGCDIYVTHSPCSQCAKAIASAGIKRVVFSEEYRDTKGIDFLKKCGLEVELIVRSNL